MITEDFTYQFKYTNPDTLDKSLCCCLYDLNGNMISSLSMYDTDETYFSDVGD